jgi:hypothetical protein
VAWACCLHTARLVCRLCIKVIRKGGRREGRDECFAEPCHPARDWEQQQRAPRMLAVAVCQGRRALSDCVCVLAGGGHHARLWV